MFYHCVLRLQNEISVKKLFKVKNILKKCERFLFYITNYKRNEKKKKQYIQLIAYIYEYKVLNIILTNITLCITSKNKMCLFNFPSLNLK